MHCGILQTNTINILVTLSRKSMIGQSSRGTGRKRPVMGQERPIWLGQERRYGCLPTASASLPISELTADNRNRRSGP